MSLKRETKSLWTAYKDVFSKNWESLPDSDLDSIEDEVVYYLKEGFTNEQCCKAAKMHLDKHPNFSDDIPYCFAVGMRSYLDDQIA